MGIAKFFLYLHDLCTDILYRLGAYSSIKKCNQGKYQ